MHTDDKEFLEQELLQLSVNKARAEIRKFMAETKKLEREAAFYPFWVGAAVATAVAAIYKLFVSP